MQMNTIVLNIDKYEKMLKELGMLKTENEELKKILLTSHNRKTQPGGNKMTAYESLKRKENILREASLRAESQDMKEMWLAKSLALRCKASEMTVEEAEREVLR